MTRTDFIEYLQAHGCETVRIANQGYCVIRNTNNGKISGVPATDPPLSATVCRICKTLEVATPEAAKDVQAIIDKIQNDFGTERFSPDNGNI